MRVLIVPMAVMSETSGSFSRTVLLCNRLVELKHEVALCAAEDPNYRKIANIKNYYAPIPSPLGTPMFIGKRLLKIVQLLKIQEKKVNSFEEVLHFIGALDSKYFAKDVDSIRRAIRSFKPDIVYAEFRISAIVAAILEKVKVVTSFSYPVQKSFASNPEYSLDIRPFLHKNKMPLIESALDIFKWTDLKIVPSSYELEPLKDVNVVFTGPFSFPKIKNIHAKKDKILVYMGYGTISPKTVINNLTKAFENTNIEVYIATNQVKSFKKNNIWVKDRFDFNELMPEAIAYINHGGQNSIMTGLIYGVPQIICPGNVFERKYNASSIVNLGAGIQLELREFKADILKKIIDDFIHNPTYENNAKKIGKELLHLGGVDRAIEAMEDLISYNLNF